MFLWHTGAAISNREKHASLTVTTDDQIDRDLAAWRTEADGVANDVLARASERMRIGIFKDHGIRRFQTYGFAKRLCFEVSVSNNFFDHLREIHTLSRTRGKTRLETGKYENLSHQRIDSGQVTLHLNKQVLGPRRKLISQQCQRKS